MTLISAPNDAWKNFESHHRAKGTREILHLSHEVNQNVMKPSDLFEFEGSYYRCGKKGHRAVDFRPVKCEKSRATDEKKESTLPIGIMAV